MSVGKVLGILVLVSACGAHTGASSSAMDDTSGPVGPGGSTEGDGEGEGGTSDDPAGSLALGEGYAMRSVLSITSGSLAPQPAYELLNDLHSDPGSALVNLAEAAGVPAAELLFDALPSSLSGKVSDWMSDAVGAEGLAQLQVLLAWSQLVLAEVRLESTLSLASLDAEGSATANHSLDHLLFRVDGVEIEEDIPQIESLPGAGHSELRVQMTSDATGTRLQFGEQRFGLLLGEAAYNAFESLVQSTYGQDLRGLLGQSIDCAAMAAEVSQQCVLSVCVGHQAELLNLCEGALDSAVAKIHEQFTAFDMELLELRAGQASLVSNAPGTQLVDGVWQARAELGQGLRDLPASFVGDSL